MEGLVEPRVWANGKELTCCREHPLATDEGPGSSKKMGTEWEKMGGQCGETGRELWRAGRREGDCNGG